MGSQAQKEEDRQECEESEIRRQASGRFEGVVKSSLHCYDHEGAWWKLLQWEEEEQEIDKGRHHRRDR